MRIIKFLLASSMAAIPDIVDPIHAFTGFSSNEVFSQIDGSVNIVMLLNHDGVLPATYKLTLSIYNASNDSKLYTKSYYPKDIVTMSNSEFSLSFPIKNRLKESGLKIVIDQEQKLKPTSTTSGIIYPYRKQNINIKKYRKEKFVNIGYILGLNDNNLYTDETFDFTNLNEYLSIGKNNTIDFSNISFTYDMPYTFICGDIYFIVRDYNNVFPLLSDNDGFIKLKMKYSVNKSEVSLSLDEKMYVNENTLEMSKNPLTNYTETNSLFIPTGKEELFMGNEIYISIYDAGYSKVDFTIPFNFYYSKKYFGQCYESDYCISGGVKE